MDDTTKLDEEKKSSVYDSLFNFFNSARTASNKPSEKSIADAVVQGVDTHATVRGATSPAPPAAYGAQPTTEPLDFGGVDANAGGREDVVGQGALNQAERGIFQGMYGTRGNGLELMGEGENYLPVGGPFGKEMVNEAFNVQPKRLEAAVKEGAEAQQREAETKQSFYATERDRTRDYESALKEQYMLRQQEMQTRMQQLEKTAQTYTNNLADQGAFWHNPQNVIAAMSAALMQLTTDDRSFGYKLLNGAIQNDLHNRRALADTHLGQLRSNMAEYDRMAGDRIAGMQLAEAEAKRVAALELQRIAAQFQGPKAKANAEAISAKLWEDVRTAYMQFYNQHIYNKPHLENKLVAQNYKAGGKAFPGVGYSGFAGKAPPGAPAGAGARPGAGGGAVQAGVPGAAMGAGAGGVQSMGAQAPGQRPRGSQALRPETLKALEDRFPAATQLIDNGYQSVQEAGYLAAGVRPGTPEELMSPAQQHAFNKAVAEERQRAYESMSKVSAGLKESSYRNSGLKAIQTDMMILEKAMSQYGFKMDDVLSSKSRTVIGNEALAKLNQLYEAHIKSDPEKASKWERERQQVNEAANRFLQLLSGDIREYYKKIGGTALTAIELPGLKQYADTGAPFSHIKNYILSESQKAHAEERAQFHQMTPAAQAMWLIQLGQGQAPIISQSVDAPPRPGSEHKQVSPNKKSDEFITGVADRLKGIGKY